MWTTNHRGIPRNQCIVCSYRGLRAYPNRPVVNKSGPACLDKNPRRNASAAVRPATRRDVSSRVSVSYSHPITPILREPRESHACYCFPSARRTCGGRHSSSGLRRCEQPHLPRGSGRIRQRRRFLPSPLADEPFTSRGHEIVRRVAKLHARQLAHRRDSFLVGRQRDFVRTGIRRRSAESNQAERPRSEDSACDSCGALANSCQLDFRTWQRIRRSIGGRRHHRANHCPAGDAGHL